VAKLAPRDLAQVLSKLPQQSRENVIVGFDTADDAGVFRLNDELAMVQTVDFFTPVADDPFIYGQVAAINSLSDVYAMGGTPLSALSIVCYPQKGDFEVLGRILEGGQSAMNANGVVVIGGHSVDDQEMKFGYAVTGVIHPKKVISNAGARAGDVLVLTKAIGTGTINTAVQQGKASKRTEQAAIEAMTTSSARASKIMVDLNASACTDITGFGLLGHAYELAKASGVTINIDSATVPLLPDVIDLIKQGMLTRGDKNNREYVGDSIHFNESVSTEMQSALFDPQTSGGLLISFSQDNASAFLERVPNSQSIGSVSEKSDLLIRVE
jgi:selenide,water dikinase